MTLSLTQSYRGFVVASKFRVNAIDDKYVSNLVFYAQSTITVISERCIDANSGYKIIGEKNNAIHTVCSYYY